MSHLLSKSEYESLASFRYALRQFLHFSDAAAQEMGLTPQQHQALLAIQGYPGRDRVTLAELAERLGIRHHSAVGLVNRLEALELVMREPGQVDRRQVYVSLTPRGLEILDSLSIAHRRELARLAPRLRRLVEEFAGEHKNG